MEDSEAFLRREHTSLNRAAYLLTGDVVAAQDLAQEAALRVLSAWPRVAAAESPAAYARKILVNAFLRDRRRFWRREMPFAVPPDLAQASRTDDLDTREVLRRALQSLTPRQRAAVVLRFLEDRPEAETAALLGVTAGTVKTLTSRGLAGLRLHLGDRVAWTVREREVTVVVDRLSRDLRALADAAEVRELDVAALRGRVAQDRRRRRAVVVLAVVVAAGIAVPLVRAVGDLESADRLASDAGGDPSYVAVVSQESLVNGADLPAEVGECLTAAATEVSTSSRLVLRLGGSERDRSQVVECLRAVDGVQVLPQSGPTPRPVSARASGSHQLTPEQAARAGVDATAECSQPDVRESAPPFEGEAPIPSAELIAGYLTDEHGRAEWEYEYNGQISFGNEPLTDRLVRLCWYAGSGEYQLVVGPVDGGLLGSNTRSKNPLPILAPPPPRQMPAEEFARRAVVFPQPPGIDVQEQ